MSMVANDRQVDFLKQFVGDSSNATPITEPSVIVPMEDYLRLVTDAMHLRELEENGVDIYGIHDEQQES